jgi:PTS system mannose-specific IID component
MALDLKTRLRVLGRLLSLQACWNYERMQGIGFGYAAEPALRTALHDDLGRWRDAVARAAGFYNANPYLAAAAIGAEARAEADGVPGPQIQRLRTALAGPLGALGDRLVWTGLVPGLVSLAVIGLVLGGGAAVVVGLLLLHNAVRLGMAAWLLELGWRHGLHVGHALQASPLPRASSAAVQGATFACAAALPVAGRWLLGDAPPPPLETASLAALVVGAIALRHYVWPRASAPQLTLLAGAAVLGWYWGVR